MHQVVAALGAATLGLLTTVGGIVAQATNGADIAPWAQVGGTSVAVGALAYVAKLLADGRLVAQPIATLQQAAAAREDKLTEMVADSHEREAALRLLLINQQREKRNRDA